MGKSPLKLQAPQQTCHRSVLASRETGSIRSRASSSSTTSPPRGAKERLVHAFQMRYFFRFELDH